MTPLLLFTSATILLVAFLVINVFSMVVREVQHKRHQREREAQLGTARFVRDQLATILEEAEDLTDVNTAAERLDGAMRRTIGEGIDLAKMLQQKQELFGALVEARREQIGQEMSTLRQWAQIRDDLEKFSEQYPAYMFVEGDKEKSS